MKIGILTFYYQSQNYGGNLQAYALASFLNKNGHEAEQLCYAYHSDHVGKTRFQRLFSNGFSAFVKTSGRYLRAVCHKCFAYAEKQEEKRHQVSARRKEAFRTFNEAYIPNNGTVLYGHTLPDTVPTYDAFITGSDQVFNPAWYQPAFLLDFVPSHKIKLAYAASIAQKSLAPHEAERFQRHLKDFSAVSLRESSAEDLIRPLTQTEVTTVVDPTLLLEAEDWGAIASPRLVDEDYLFCYFLGNNRRSRRLAEEFAKKNGLTLVTVPHAGGKIQSVDIGFGDKPLYDATPMDFLSLIRHAKYVFTDSFHAVVFSHIFKREFFVFQRNKNGDMSTRIEEVTRLFGAPDRFIATKEMESLSHLEALLPLDHTRDLSSLNNLKQASISFLLSHLGGNT